MENGPFHVDPQKEGGREEQGGNGEGEMQMVTERRRKKKDSHEDTDDGCMERKERIEWENETVEEKIQRKE